MGDCTRSWRSLQVSCLRRQFVQGSGLPFSEALSAELVGHVLRLGGRLLPRANHHPGNDIVDASLPSDQSR
jgi:hypothetical protein